MQTYNTNSLAATGQLLRLKGIIYQPQQLKDDLLGHPDYPSLFAVHHVLNQYGLDNSPVEATAEYLDELGQPFLAYMQLPGIGNDFATVNRVHNGSITYTNTKGKAETISREDFLSKWKNVAVIASPKASPNPSEGGALDPNNSGFNSTKHGFQNPPSEGREAYSAPVRVPTNRNIFTNRNAGLAALIALIIIATLNAATPFIFAPWLLLKLGGLAVTVLLLMYEADRQNETVKQFCSAGKTINCDAVLQSKGAKIGPYSWSEMGFAYFAGTFLYLLLASNNPNAWLPLALLSLLVLPYTIYSIYYQYKIVKHWCKLCLFIQGVILVEAVFALLAIVWPADWQVFNWQVALIGLPLLVLPLVIWLALKSTFKNATNFDKYKYAYMRLQNDPEVFNAMLKRQAAAPSGYRKLGIRIGNPNASNTIIKVCNPFCGPCALVHPILEEIVEKYDTQMYILFTGTNNDSIGKISRHFLALNNFKGTNEVKTSMHWWYNSKVKDEKELYKQFPVENVDSTQIKKQLDEMELWIKAAEIRFTPTLFVNGFRLPETYTAKDLIILFGNE